MKNIFGIVPSRRLGMSLGLSPIPISTCTYSCIYCQLGRTRKMTYKRNCFFPLNDLTSQLKTFQSKQDKFDIITLVGEGEPTLYNKMGKLIEKIKIMFNKKVALITNGSLFYLEDVRKEASLADIVMPSLDAWDENSFAKINRSTKKIKYNDMYEGMLEFRKKYKGEFYLEAMCISGITDVNNNKELLVQKIKKLNPDKVFINTPVRPPAEVYAKRCSKEFIEELQVIFKSYKDVEIPNYDLYSLELNTYDAIIEIIKRHPLNIDNIKQFCKIRNENFEVIIEKLSKNSIVEKIQYENNLFFRINAKIFLNKK